MNTNSLVQINEGLVFAVIAIVWVLYRIIRNLMVGKVDFVREAVLNLAFLYGCLVFEVTFFPMVIVLYSFDPYDSNLIPLVGTLQMIQHASRLAVIRNLAGNLILLMPLGFFLPIFFKPVRQVWKILGTGFLVSLSIELSQLFLAVRIFDVDDLIFNTLSVLIGFLFFRIFIKVSFLSRMFEKIANSKRKWQIRAFAGYCAFVTLAFLSIYSYQIVQQTETETDILNTLPAIQQTSLGASKFGGFMFVFSQSGQGNKFFALYRRVFFNRYTLFEWGDLHLDENHYTVSGQSFGHAMSYFVIARSQGKAVTMASEGSRFPVVEIGEYYFSYASFPLNESDHILSFHFLDSQGHELALAKEQ